MVSFALNSLHLFSLFSLYKFYPYAKAQGHTNRTLGHYLSNCNTAINYSHGTAYDQNLNLTLSSLVSSVALNGFSNVTVGQNPDIVYGLLQCRGDVSNHFCEVCAKTVARQIRQLCPNQKEATLLKRKCTLQYSYQPFSSVTDISQIMVLFKGRMLVIHQLL